MNALSNWIRADHLSDPAILSYRRQFEAHPARMVILQQFLQEEVALRLSKFLSCEAEFRPEFGLYSTGDDAANEEAWLNASEDDKFFRFSKLVEAYPQFRLSPNALTYLRFRKAFQDPDFRRFFGELSGMNLGPSQDFGSHLMGPGDFLKSHDDNNRNRRLAIVYYLTPEWKPEYGGFLNMIDRCGCTNKIEPEYNSIVIFDVGAGTKHFVDPIVSEVRLTIGGWYHNPNKD